MITRSLLGILRPIQVGQLPRLASSLLGLVCCASSILLAEHPHPITVPEGFSVELVAAAPLVQYPMLGCLDDRGRLFLAESGGRNLNEVQLDELRPNSIRMLEDRDGDGVFDHATVFADSLAIPNGVLWLDGSLYIAEPPGIWRLTDTDDDGVADKREHVAGNVRSNGMSSTLHGPVLHPSGRLFWCGGQMNYSLDRDGTPPEGRVAPGIFSLRPDGTQHEVFAVGGRANPVEVAFGRAGDIFGTIAILEVIEGARYDALMHWVHGGLYASDDPLPDAIHRTGPRLPPLSRVGQVAPAGILRYRSDQLGPAYQHNLFWAQFNTGTVVRSTLTPQGGTFTAQDEDFLVCEEVDFHPTDVIEDADGSLLVIDTGGWFRHGCPTSRIARPEALGAIYRVRRDGAHRQSDPRGLEIDWAGATAEMLVDLLADDRPAVVDRAIDRLVQQGPASLAVVSRAVHSAAQASTRLQCVWILSRQDTAASLDAIIPALKDSVADVRQAAATALGLSRHQQASSALQQRLRADETLAVRREAAVALARLGDVSAVAPLLASLASSSDPFFQHAVIDALIRIGHPQPLIEALGHPAAALRRGAILALSQLSDVKLQPQRLQPMLVDRDPTLRAAAWQVARHESELSTLLPTATITLLADREKMGTSTQREAFQDSLLDGVSDQRVQAAIAAAYAMPELSVDTKAWLLEVMHLAQTRTFPPKWLSIVKSALSDQELALQQAALKIVAARRLPEFDQLLLAAATNDRLPADLRIGCLETVAPRLSEIPDPLFDWALRRLGPAHDSLERMAAARAVAAMNLNEQQLAAVTAAMRTVDAFIVAPLLATFAKTSNTKTVDWLLDALADRDDVDALPPEQLAGLMRQFPSSSQSKAASLLARMGIDLEQQAQRLDALMPLTAGGDVLRGKQVFYGKKASCAACHRVKGQGALIGPNLTTIATVRSPRDLLESIVYPSASLVQGFHPVNVLTSDGRVLTGLETRRSETELWLVGADLKEQRIRVDEIEEISQASTSIMPQGLDQQLSAAELRDLLAFLLDLKPSPSYLTEE